MERPAVRTLLWPGYAVAVLLIAFPLADLAANIWPFRVAAVEWRFGVASLLSGLLLTPLLGLVGLVAVAAALDHQHVLRVVALLSLVLAVVVVFGLGVFVLDWLQMRGGMEAAARRSMDIGSLKVLVKHLLTAITLALAGLALRRVGRTHRAGGQRARSIRARGSEGVR